MIENQKKEKEEIIQYIINHGEITIDSKFWNDLEVMGEEGLLKNKIIKITIYTGKYKNKDAIIGIDFTFKNYFSGEIKSNQEHRGSENFQDFKELNINSDEYLIDFHIRYPENAEYISQIGFKTSKGNQLLVGTEVGDEREIESNGGDNIIVGTFGCFNEKLDAMGIYYVNKKQYLKKKCYALIMLNHLAKTDEDFKKETNKCYEKLGEDFKYIWKTVNLPDAAFSQIMKYCAI